MYVLYILMLDQFYWKIKHWFIIITIFFDIVTTIKSSNIKKWKHLNKENIYT